MFFEIIPAGEMRRHSGQRNTKKTFSDLKECGFTTSPFIEPADIPAAREAGLKTISFMYFPKEIKAPEGIHTFYLSSDNRYSLWSMIPDKSVTKEDIDEAVRVALEDFPEGEGCVFIADEPSVVDYDRIRYMADAVKKYRPDLEPWVNLFPNYAVCGKPDMSQLGAESYDDYLEQYCKVLGDIPMCVDNYDIIIGMDNQQKNIEAGYYLNLIQCRDACDKYGVELYYIVSCNQLRTFTTIPTMSNLMLQAFTVIAAGARKIGWFNYFGRNQYCFAPVDDNGDEDIRTPMWYMLREVNRRTLSMGNELYNMAYKGMYFSDTLGIPRAKNVSECETIKSFTSDLPCMVGMYEDNGEPVAIVVNMSLEHSSRVSIDLGGDGLVTWSTEEDRYIKPLVELGIGYPEPRYKVSPMWLAPGEAMIVRAKK